MNKKLYKVVESINGIVWDRIIENKPSGKFETASEKEKFDYCIKQKFLAGENYLPGQKLPSSDESFFGFYIPRYKRYYDRYLSDNFNLEKLVSEEIQKQYNKGAGNEFKSGKFHSVASSSRFAVSSFSEVHINDRIELLKKLDINGQIENVTIKLEQGLAVSGIKNNTTIPLMDVVIETNTCDTYFVEVKCHEIFDTSEHKKIKLKWKYKEANAFKKLPLDHDSIKKKIVTTKKGTNEYVAVGTDFLTAKDFGCQLATTHFDFKQFLCHLMGIESYRERCKGKVHFYYLFYKNEEYLRVGNDKIYDELEAEMKEIFRVFSKAFPEIDFGFCYNNGFDTIKSLSKIV